MDTLFQDTGHGQRTFIVNLILFLSFQSISVINHQDAKIADILILSYCYFPFILCRNKYSLNFQCLSIKFGHLLVGISILEFLFLYQSLKTPNNDVEL